MFCTVDVILGLDDRGGVYLSRIDMIALQLSNRSLWPPYFLVLKVPSTSNMNHVSFAFFMKCVVIIQSAAGRGCLEQQHRTESSSFHSGLGDQNISCVDAHLLSNALLAHQLTSTADDTDHPTSLYTFTASSRQSEFDFR